MMLGFGTPAGAVRTSVSSATKSCCSVRRRDFLALCGTSIGALYGWPSNGFAAVTDVDTDFSKIEARLNAASLVGPTIQAFPQEPILADWLEGYWSVNSTTKSVVTPDPDLILPEDLESILKTQEKTVSYRVRFAPKRDGSGIATDRAYNIAQKLNAYAGTELVTRVEWTPGSTRAVAVFSINPGARTVQLLQAAKTGSAGDKFVTRELFRQIFVNPNSAEPPKLTDYEVITMYNRGAETVYGKERVAVYLSPTADFPDQALVLPPAAQQQVADQTLGSAVLITDNVFEMRRLANSIQ